MGSYEVLILNIRSYTLIIQSKYVAPILRECTMYTCIREYMYTCICTYVRAHEYTCIH